MVHSVKATKKCTSRPPLDRKASEKDAPPKTLAALRVAPALESSARSVGPPARAVHTSRSGCLPHDTGRVGAAASGIVAVVKLQLGKFLAGAELEAVARLKSASGRTEPGNRSPTLTLAAAHLDRPTVLAPWRRVARAARETTGSPAAKQNPTHLQPTRTQPARSFQEGVMRCHHNILNNIESHWPVDNSVRVSPDSQILQYGGRTQRETGAAILAYRSCYNTVII